MKHFKKIVSQFKDQLNVLDDARLLTMADVNSAITSLFKNTGLAKVKPSYSIPRLQSINVHEKRSSQIIVCIPRLKSINVHEKR